MRFFLTLMICSLLLVSCLQENTNPFNINSEPLTTNAELKASTWNGYNDFVFELKDLAFNASKENAMEKASILLSKSQAILYSMPSELRNEMTQEKATELVEATKQFHDSIATTSQQEIPDLLIKVVNAYNVLNKEINYYTMN